MTTGMDERTGSVDRIAIQVIEHLGRRVNDAPVVFGVQGGSIGRSGLNELVLPDPERLLSRIHARIHWDRDHFTIEVCGTQLLINGQPLGQGRRTVLAPGDRLLLGDYALLVSSTTEPPTAAATTAGPVKRDDWALFAGTGTSVPSAPGHAAAAAGASASASDALHDFFDNLPHDPTDTAAFSAAPPPAAPTTPESPEAVWFGIAAPARLPRAETFTAALAVHVASMRATAAHQLQRFCGPQAEPLMDLSPATSSGWRIGAPVEVRLTVHGGTVEPQLHRFAWNGRIHLAAFLVKPDAPDVEAVTLGFHVLLAGVPVGHIPWQVDLAGRSLPSASTARQAPSSAFASYASGDSQAVGLCLSALAHWAPTLRIFQDCLDLHPGDTFKPQLARHIADAEAFLLFWSRRAAASPWVRWELDTAWRDKPHDALIPMPLEDPAIAPPPPELADRHWRDRFMLARYGMAQVAAEVDGLAEAAAGLAALQAALCDGLRLPALPTGTLTPALMRLIGSLLHDSVHGLMALLNAASAPRPVRPAITLINARENNPLKFSPSAPGALAMLLGPPAPGFMPPDKAARDAFDVLLAEAAGLPMGLHAALTNTLHNFDPAVLEARLAQAAAPATLLPRPRDARMWSAYKALHAQIAAQAADAFLVQMGEASARAAATWRAEQKPLE